MSHKAKTIRAKWILNPGQTPVRDAFLSIHDGKIVSISSRPDGRFEDLGDVALIPGLVNCHTHLEFSHLTQPLGHRGNAFPDWLKCVIAHRQDDTVAPKSERVQLGYDESTQSGVIAIGEIATHHSASTLPTLTEQNSSEGPNGHRAHVIAFQEWLSLATDQAPRLVQQQWDLERATENHPICSAGVSPHAPYTIHPETFESACLHAEKEQLPIAMHIAETEEELQLLATGNGPLRDFLESLGVFQSSAFQPSRSIAWYLNWLARAPRALVVHGNYLDSAQLRWLAKHRDRMSLVYCPRTHDYFEHSPYPLHDALDAGVRVTLGTDSRASNPDLNIWSEFRFLIGKFPSLDVKRAFSMITVDGALALGLPESSTLLAPGAPATFNTFQVDADESDPWESIRSETAEVLTSVRFE